MSNLRLTLMFAWLLFGATANSIAADGFDETAVGKLPVGWSVGKGDSEERGIWKIQEDATAPKGKKVLTQSSSAGANSLFNLCVSDRQMQSEVDATISVKAIGGTIDQGGGPVWRYQDENNYYIARVNPLEDNFRLYKVIDGKRIQLATADVDATVGMWHTIRIQHQGARIRCSLDGKELLEATDESIVATGKIGVWTKADAVTSFTSPTMASGLADAAPSQVLVVNTQDASVSLVDLNSMKEVSRNPVGPRPYGIAVSKDGKTMAVGVEDEECVKFYSLPDFKLKGRTTIGKMFNDHIVLTQDGRSVMVANFYSDDVVIIDIESRKETGRIAGCSAPHVVKFGPLKQRAFVTCKKVTGIALIDPVSQQLIKFHQLNINPRSLTFSPDESKIYFASFWTNGFFELDSDSGKVTQLLSFDPPAGNSGNQEVTYHGVESLGNNIVLAANEGRSYVDAVDVTTGKLLDRLTTVNKPCCLERIPGSANASTRVLISNIGDGTLQLVEVLGDGKIKDLKRTTVGKAPKRVAFVPAFEN